MASAPASDRGAAGTAVRGRETSGAESAGKIRAVTRIATAAPATIDGHTSSADLRRWCSIGLSGRSGEGIQPGAPTDSEVLQPAQQEDDDDDQPQCHDGPLSDRLRRCSAG